MIGSTFSDDVADKSTDVRGRMTYVSGADDILWDLGLGIAQYTCSLETLMSIFALCFTAFKVRHGNSNVPIHTSFIRRLRMY